LSPQAQRFTLAQAHGERYGVERLKTITFDRSQKRSSLIRREGLDLVLLDSRAINENRVAVARADGASTWTWSQTVEASPA